MCRDGRPSPPLGLATGHEDQVHVMAPPAPVDPVPDRGCRPVAKPSPHHHRDDSQPKPAPEGRLQCAAGYWVCAGVAGVLLPCSEPCGGLGIQWGTRWCWRTVLAAMLGHGLQAPVPVHPRAPCMAAFSGCVCVCVCVCLVGPLARLLGGRASRACGSCSWTACGTPPRAFPGGLPSPRSPLRLRFSRPRPCFRWG
jgi:hypothetical protein